MDAHGSVRSIHYTVRCTWNYLPRESFGESRVRQAWTNTAIRQRLVRDALQFAVFQFFSSTAWSNWSGASFGWIVERIFASRIRWIRRGRFG